MLVLWVGWVVFVSVFTYLEGKGQSEARALSGVALYLGEFEVGVSGVRVINRCIHRWVPCLGKVVHFIKENTE